MTDVLGITVPIYLTVLVGYLAVRSGRVKTTENHALGRFAIDFALPALVFMAIAGQRLADTLNWAYIGSYFAGSAGVGLVVLAAMRWIGHRGETAAACYALGYVSSNSAFVGYPVLLLAVPKVAGTALALNTVVENLMVMPLFLFLAESGLGTGAAGHSTLRAIGRVLTRPLVIGLFAGLLVALSGLQMPIFISRTMEMFALASGVLTLFFVGGTLAESRMAPLLGGVATLVVTKLVLHPVGVGLAIALIGTTLFGGLDADLKIAAVLMAAMPVMAMYSVLVQRYHAEDSAAAALLLTTLGSFVTLNVLLWTLLRHAS
jgi:predicted permease